ncbi:MAG: type II toxin-antitoxin system Phd/YefM family antitoxin [Candidatus Limnocylindrales bacterium]
MKTVGAYAAKTHLPRLLDEVERGQRITITKHGRPVAMLVPPGTSTAVDAEALIGWMREFRRDHPLDGATIRELIDDGRR